MAGLGAEGALGVAGALHRCAICWASRPAEADPSGETYCFERGARKDTGGDGWADVWKRHHFAYKGQRADLNAAFDQLRQYSLAREPAVADRSDMVGPDPHQLASVSRTHEALEDLADASTRTG